MLRARVAIVAALLALAGRAPAAPIPEDGGPVSKATGPLRVLLMAGAASREYQFVKRLLLREAAAKKVVLTVYLQPPPGRAEKPFAVRPDVPPARALTRFPPRLEEGAEARRQPGDLGAYDVVVAFDPDWGRLSGTQVAALRKWVKARGGGLVLVAGTINLPQLAKTSARFELLQTLLPVDLGDGRADKRRTDRPWRLRFPEMKTRPSFLKLEAKGKGPLAGWDEFFGKKGAEQGFYSCYPIRAVRAGAVVLATFTDPKARLSRGTERPFLVTRVAGLGRVVYLGSGEIWRLGRYRQDYHPRFWLGLLDYAGGRKD
jgi:hypothetical protein